MKNFLLNPLASLQGVGSALARRLAHLINGNKIFDLLLHKPLHAEKILFCPRLFEVQNGELVIIKAKVESHIKSATNKQPYKVICYNPTGYLTLVFFKIFPGQLAKMKIGSEIAILGHLQRFRDENQITHPQEILPANEIEKLPKLNVIYPLIAGITQKFLTKKIHESLRNSAKKLFSSVAEKNDHEQHEWIDQNLKRQKLWPNFHQALCDLHYFTSNHNDILQEENKFRIARERLAYDELLAWQIAILLAKNNLKKNKKFVAAEKNLLKQFLAQLPFEPTHEQLQAIFKIEAEILSGKKMLRLLQGDVGSGKTIVAIAACLISISQKKQTCVIVPTTVLAKQHFAYFNKFLGGFDSNIKILTSATTKKQKAEIRENLSAGITDILISTHAVLEDDIKFKNLGLAIIDEQHRFGVMQRLKLVEKGEDVDLLLMSATPIPRSLMMALYGDMDVSIISKKPKNRQKVETLIMSAQKIDEVHEALKRAVLRGEKIYWICPVIDDCKAVIDRNKLSGVRPNADENYFFDADGLVSVKQKFSELVEIFGQEKVGLLHGKMKEKEKEKIMYEFAHKALQILVATTVIEVGIDVADATIILIENAENFGLSQLHQLRGRVGRSDKKSFCILLYNKKLGSCGRSRLNILRQSNDGFFIAEEDLKIRGSGELLGKKQSGFPEFKIADLGRDSSLLKIARKSAETILQNDVLLQRQRCENLLALFGYEQCLKMIRSG